jgi:hypothetical protein
MLPLFAYIDPFTGSLILQLLAMGFASVVIFFKKIKAFVLGFFGIKKNVESDLESADVLPFKSDKPSEAEKKAA